MKRVWAAWKSSYICQWNPFEWVNVSVLELFLISFHHSSSQYSVRPFKWDNVSVHGSFLMYGLKIYLYLVPDHTMIFGTWFFTFWGCMASKEAKYVTFEPLDRFQHLRGHFGVVFWDQFNADIILGRGHTLLSLHDL